MEVLEHVDVVLGIIANAMAIVMAVVTIARDIRDHRHGPRGRHGGK